MKKYLALIALALALPSAPVKAGIVGSAHDFSLSIHSSPTVGGTAVTTLTSGTGATNAWNSRAGVCSVCHSAHNTDPNQNAPLWQHYTPAQTYTTYSSATLVGTTSVAAISVTRACLSCHDGQTAINASFKTPVPTKNAGYVSGSKSFGTDLHNVHPVGIQYDSSTYVAQHLNDPGQTLSALWSTIAPGTDAANLAPGLEGLTIAKALTRNGAVECVSCHDPHFNLGATGPLLHSSTKISGVDVNGRGSTLCRTCHNK